MPRNSKPTRPATPAPWCFAARILKLSPTTATISPSICKLSPAPPKSSIREVRVNQNPFSAQYDRLGYGRIEIFTKPGTENFHGELVFAYGNGVFNSRNPFADVRPYFERRQWEGEVTGP